MNGLMLKYFVIKPDGDTEYHRASRAAMVAYAKQIKSTNKELHDDLIEWVRKVT